MPPVFYHSVSHYFYYIFKNSCFFQSMKNFHLLHWGYQPADLDMSIQRIFRINYTDPEIPHGASGCHSYMVIGCPATCNQTFLCCQGLTAVWSVGGLSRIGRLLIRSLVIQMRSWCQQQNTVVNKFWCARVQLLAVQGKQALFRLWHHSFQNTAIFCALQLPSSILHFKGF